MAEGVLLLSLLLRDLAVSPVEGKTPIPEAHLTVRARVGIWLDVKPRSNGAFASSL